MSAACSKRPAAAFRSTFWINVCGAPQYYRDPGAPARKIADIAFACGFGDLSCFNRASRRRYGATPSDMREAARRAED